MYSPSDITVDLLQSIINATDGKRKIAPKVHLLDGGEQFVEDISGIFTDGEIDIDTDRDVTRAAKLTITNTNGDYTLESTNPFGKIWYDSRFAIYYGIYSNSLGRYYWIPVGIYLLDFPSCNSQGGMQLNLIGKNSLINYHNGEEIYLESNLSLNEALRRIICNIDHQEDSPDGSTYNTNFTWSGSKGRVSTGGAYGGCYTRFTVNDAYVEWTTICKQFTWCSVKTTANGIANVYIDGVLDCTVDLYSASTLHRQHVYSKEFPYGGQHTIKVERSGTKNASSSDYYVGIDALQASRSFTDSEIVFESLGKTLDKEISYTADQNRWLCSKELAESFSTIIYEDGEGKIRAKVYPVFSEQASCWSYSKGNDSLLLSIDKTNRGPKYNHVVISYGGANDAVNYEERKAEDDDGGSEFKTSGPYGNRILVQRDSNVTTAAEALIMAKRLLEENLSMSEEITLNVVTNPLHEPHDKITIIEGDYAKIANDYSLRSFTIPLKPGGQQRFSVKKLRLI